MTSALHRRLAVGLATAATAGVLAGCGGSDDEPTTAAAGPAPAADASSADPSSASTEATPSTGSSPYADGTYAADGSYQSPGGKETVGVSLTLKDGTVTAVEITPKATDQNGIRFQGEFRDGIASEVVGKSIDDLQVSKVSGSSLTSGGFNQAVERIKAEAQG